MYDQLRHDHADLVKMARDLRRRIAVPALTDAGGLGSARWQLARTLTRHLAVEDAHVYTRLDKDPRPGVAAISRRYKRELGYLRDQFSTHMVRWTGDAIAQDWPGYCAALGTLLDALEARIRCEETELYPLIAPPANRTVAA